MKGFARSLAIYSLVIVLVILFVNMIMNPSVKATQELTYTELINELNKDNVKTIKFVENNITGTLKDDTKFKTYIPTLVFLSSDFYDKYISPWRSRMGF